VAVTAVLWLSSSAGPQDLDRDGTDGAEVGAAVDVDDLAGHVDEDGAWDGDDQHDQHGGEHGPAEGSHAPDLVVHVSGAVADPGLVTVPDGARVGEALSAAGGPTADAEVDRLNLAQPLSDGERVHVPREGEADPPGASTGGGENGAGADPQGRVDLNRATAQELETLPGIGPARAQAIVEHREAHGPFGEPGDLRAVSGIGEATFQRLADLVGVS
jgi:competence protein ComEA